MLSFQGLTSKQSHFKALPSIGTNLLPTDYDQEGNAISQQILENELTIEELQFLLNLERSEQGIPPPNQLAQKYATWAQQTRFANPKPASLIQSGFLTQTLRSMRQGSQAPLVDIIRLDLEKEKAQKGPPPVFLEPSQQTLMGRGESAEVRIPTDTGFKTYNSGVTALSFHSQLLARAFRNGKQHFTLDTTHRCRHREPHLTPQLFERFLLYTVYGGTDSPDLASIYSDQERDMGTHSETHQKILRQMFGALQDRRSSCVADVLTRTRTAERLLEADLSMQYEKDLKMLQQRYEKLRSSGQHQIQVQHTRALAGVNAFFDSEMRKAASLAERFCSSEKQRLEERGQALEHTLTPILEPPSVLPQILQMALQLEASGLTRLVLKRLAEHVNAGSASYSDLAVLGSCYLFSTSIQSEFLSLLTTPALRWLSDSPTPPVPAESLALEISYRRRIAVDEFSALPESTIRALIAALKDKNNDPTPLETALIREQGGDRVVAGVKLSSIAFPDVLEEVLVRRNADQPAMTMKPAFSCGDCTTPPTVVYPEGPNCEQDEISFAEYDGTLPPEDAKCVALADAAQLLPKTPLVFSPLGMTFATNAARQRLMAVGSVPVVVSPRQSLYFECDILEFPSLGAELVIGAVDSEVRDPAQLSCFSQLSSSGHEPLSCVISSSGTLYSSSSAISFQRNEGTGGPLERDRGLPQVITPNSVIGVLIQVSSRVVATFFADGKKLVSDTFEPYKKQKESPSEFTFSPHSSILPPSSLTKDILGFVPSAGEFFTK